MSYCVGIDSRTGVDRETIKAQAALVKLDVSLSAAGLLTVVIEDDGTGMSEELLARVTSPFATTPEQFSRIGRG